MQALTAQHIERKRVKATGNTGWGTKRSWLPTSNPIGFSTGSASRLTSTMRCSKSKEACALSVDGRRGASLVRVESGVSVWTMIMRQVAFAVFSAMAVTRRWECWSSENG